MRGKLFRLTMLSAFVSLAAFMAQEVDARGGRGGGGRGGGGFSRGGASSMSRGGGGFSRGGSMSRGGGMSRGSYNRGGSGFSRGGSYSRPGGAGYSRPSNPGAANRMTSGGRPSQLPAGGRGGVGRPGGVGGVGGVGGPGRPGGVGGIGGAGGVGGIGGPGGVGRPGQGGGGVQRPGNRPGQGGGINNSGNRINTGDRNTNIDIDNDWGGDWDGWGDYPLAAGIAIGATAAWATAVAYGSAYYALPPGCSPYPYHTYTYYSCGGAYYQPQYEGDTVVYVSVPDPASVTVQQ